jgi:hypothetical protein
MVMPINEPCFAGRDWQEKTWNVIVGCSRVSAGCDNCYAIGECWRMSGDPRITQKHGVNPYAALVQIRNGRLDFSGRLHFFEDRLDTPLRVKKPTVWFVNSLSDLYHDEVSPDTLRRVFDVMNRADWHIYDHSIWEAAKKTSPSSLKRLINSELENTSVTVVLIGSDTWARRWVRYEIFKSIERGNRVLGIHVNCIKGKDQMTKPIGPNPFDFLALEFTSDSTLIKPTVWEKNAWYYYTDLDPYTPSHQPNPNRGTHVQLNRWCPNYDWVKDGGYQNFNSWIS